MTTSNTEEESPIKAKKPLPPPPRYDSSLKLTKKLNSDEKEKMPLPPPPPPPPPPHRDANVHVTHTSPEIDKVNDLKYDRQQIPGGKNNGDIPTEQFADNRKKAPPLLAARQSSLPVLLIPTSTANSDLCEEKNGVTLSQLLTTIGGSVFGLNTNFRSISKSFLLDTVDLRFIQGQCVNPLLLDTDQENARTYIDDQLSYASCALKEDDGSIPDQELNDCILKELHKEVFHHDTLRSNEELGEANSYLQDSAEKGAQLLTSPDLPWFRRLRLLLDSSTDNMPHEMLGYPIVVLLVASSSDADFIECFRELMVNHHLPHPFHTGHYDPGPNLRRYFVLLHDNIDGPENFNEQVATNSFHKAFPGQPFRVLRLNSVPQNSQQNNKQHSLWYTENIDVLLNFQNQSNDKNIQVKGRCLSPEDMVSIRSFIFDLTKNGIVPEMERRIFNLNVEVSNAKRGVRNAIKSLWRKPKENDNRSLFSTRRTVSEYIVKYTYDQIESQVRLLADSLLLVGDYDAALSIYRLVKSDYSSDKATLYYASINEMIALCLYKSDCVRHSRDIFSAVENALFSYGQSSEEDRFSSNQKSQKDITVQKSSRGIGILATRLASRLALVMCASEMTLGRQYDYAECLAGASVQETPLIAAVLLEQAALSYFKASMFRKYAFHLVMAGHMYRASKQEQHGSRCFTAALNFYRKTHWGPLYCHLQSSLAHQAHALNNTTVAFQIYVRLAASRDMSARIQQKVMQNLLEICKNTPTDLLIIGSNDVGLLQIENNSDEVLEIRSFELPMISNNSINVTSETPPNHEQGGKSNEVMFNTLTNVDDEQNQWRDMVMSLEAEIFSSKHHYSIGSYAEKFDDEQLKASFEKKRSTKPSIRALEEPFIVTVDLYNPLAIPLTFTKLQLVAEHENDGEIFLITGAKLLNEQEGKKQWTFNGSKEIFGEPDLLHDSVNIKNAFVVNKQDIEIEPKSFIKVYLHMCPLVPGKLSIKGMRCKLFDQVWVFHEFNVSGPLLRMTREQRSKRERGKSQLLEFQISEKMARLVASIKGGHVSALQGEVMEWKLQIRNIGMAPASNIILKSNMPWLCLLNDDATLDQQYLSRATSNCIGRSGTAIALSENYHLEPGNQTTFRIKARVSGGGRQTLRLLLRYDAYMKPYLKQSVYSTRYLAKSLTYTVYPSINLSALCQPSFDKIGKYVLSVEITNYRGDKYSNEDVEIIYLAIISSQFKAIIYPDQIKMNEPLKLGSQERASLFFELKPKVNVNDSSRSLLSEIMFSDNCDEIFSPHHGGSIFDFPCLEGSFDSLNKSLKDFKKEREKLLVQQSNKPRSIHEIRRANENKVIETENHLGDQHSLDHPTSVSTHFGAKLSAEISKLSLVCHWRSKGFEDIVGDTIGEHFTCSFPLENVGSCPFVMTGKYPAQLIHDFQSKPQLEIEIEVKIRRNRLVNEISTIMIEMVSTEKETSPFHFVGLEKVLYHVDHEKDLVLPLKVIFTSSGVFDIQTLCLNSYTKSIVDEQPNKSNIVRYTFDQQWIVRINA